MKTCWRCWRDLPLEAFREPQHLWCMGCNREAMCEREDAALEKRVRERKVETPEGRA